MLHFNQTSSPYDGLIQRCEVNVFGEDGLTRISGNSKLLGLWTTRLNQAKLKLDSFVLTVDGKQQHDDPNHTDISPITTDAVINQREYEVDTDENGNKILEILKVYYKNGDVYEILEPTDELTEPDIYDGQDITGVPTKYGKKGNLIILDKLPESTVTDGLKLEVTREGYYFLTTDTTKTGGYNLYDYVIADLACFEYARFNTIANVNLTAPYIEESKSELKKYISRLGQDEVKKITHKKINFI